MLGWNMFYAILTQSGLVLLIVLREDDLQKSAAYMRVTRYWKKLRYLKKGKKKGKDGGLWILNGVLLGVVDLAF